MDTNKAKIIEMIWNSDATEKTLQIAPKRWRDDLRSHLFMILLEMDDDKLINLWNKGEMDKYIWGICQRQFKKGNRKKPTSSFWKEMRMWDDGEIVDADKIVDDIFKEDLLDIWDKKSGEILDKFYYVNVNNINYFFNRKVFELYYLEGMTFKQISSNTNISYETIRKSVYFTLDFVKKELKRYENDID